MKRASASIEMMRISQKAAGRFAIYFKLRCSPPSATIFEFALIYEAIMVFTSSPWLLRFISFALNCD